MGVDVQIAIGVLSLLLVAWNLIWTSAISTRTRKIDQLEGELKRAAEELIDQKMATMMVQEQACRASSAEKFGSVEARLRWGEDQFRVLNERDHQLQVDLLKAINDLKDVVATKDDLRRLREELRS